MRPLEYSAKEKTVYWQSKVALKEKRVVMQLFKQLNHKAASKMKATNRQGFMRRDKLAETTPSVNEEQHAGVEEVIVVSNEDCNGTDEGVKSPK